MIFEKTLFSLTLYPFVLLRRLLLLLEPADGVHRAEEYLGGDLYIALLACLGVVSVGYAACYGGGISVIVRVSQRARLTVFRHLHSC
jgi:hypothetical protein